MAAVTDVAEAASNVNRFSASLTMWVIMDTCCVCATAYPLIWF